MLVVKRRAGNVEEVEGELNKEMQEGNAKNRRERGKKKKLKG
jgi:hypothetical protein